MGRHHARCLHPPECAARAPLTVEVPPGAVVHNAGNPVGEAIVWWNAVPVDDDNETGIFIRCFVPGDGA